MRTEIINSTKDISLSSSISMEFASVPGVTFMMGSNESKREQPIHKVTLKDYWMGVYPVTNQQYAVFLNDYRSDTVKAGKYKGQHMIDEHRWGMQHNAGVWVASPGYEQHPVIRVSWYGAYTFCEWLSDPRGNTFGLPSEAQWEYAARGGQLGIEDRFRYSGSHHLKEVGWYEGNSHGETKPVGLKFPNQLGVYDLSGNVWEWCMDHWHDTWHDTYEGAPDDGSPWLTEDESFRRVVRGGSWDFTDYYCRVSGRRRNLPNNWFGNQGFRVCGYF